MKISLALRKPDALTPQTARGCAGTNVALPGFGSIMAGLTVGYPQAALTVVAFALTLVFGVKFLVWGVKNWSVLHDPEANPLETWTALWQHGRWAFLGCTLFVADWLWALTTNFSILRAARKNETKAMPPKLT